MKKYRINWLTVSRNIIIILFIIVCNKANKQIEDYDNKIVEFRHEVENHKHKNIKQNEVYNYMSFEKEESQSHSGGSENDTNLVYLGNFKITHYCACKKCCGPNAQGITASGKKVQEGKTIAVDTKVIKMGSQVKIDGYGTYEAQDTGSAIKGNKIDVYVADHQRALQMGVTYKDVWLVKEV